MKEKIIKRTCYILSIAFSIITILFSICGFITTGFFNNNYNDSNENVYFCIDNVFLNLICIAIFLIIIYYIFKLINKIDKKIVLSVILILISSLSLIWIIFSRAPLRADQKMIDLAASRFLCEDYDMLKSGDYLFMHPLQLGIVYYLKIIYQLFNTTDFIIIRILNIIYLVISLVLIDKIGKRLLNYNENINKRIYIMFLLFIPLIFFTTYVYGNIVGLLFSLLAVYLMMRYLENKKIINMILSSFSIILSIILKNNYLITMIAMIIVILLYTIQKFDWKNVIYIVMLLVLYKFSSFTILKYTESLTGVNINDGIPMVSYIDMGMAEKSDRSAGWYNAKRNVESIYIENNYNKELSEKDSKIAIKNRIIYFLNNPKELFLYYSEKVGSTWLEPTFQSIWINAPAEEIECISLEDRSYIEDNNILISIHKGKLNKAIVKYLDIYQIIVYFTSGIYVLKNIKSINYTNIIFILIFMGGLAFHILWETKSSYVINYFLLLIPYSCLGIDIIFKYIQKWYREVIIRIRNKRGGKDINILYLNK